MHFIGVKDKYITFFLGVKREKLLVFLLDGAQGKYSNRGVYGCQKGAVFGSSLGVRADKVWGLWIQLLRLS